MLLTLLTWLDLDDKAEKAQDFDCKTGRSPHFALTVLVLPSFPSAITTQAILVAHSLPESGTNGAEC